MIARAASLAALLLLHVDAGASELELEDCRISLGPSFPGIKARCGTMLRPENPDDADSEMITLNVAVVPALNLEPQPDPVVPLAGGPGQGALQFYVAYAQAFEPLRRDRDILLVDQRGTGNSATMDCEFDDELVEGQFSTAVTVRYTRECLESLPHDPRYFTTSTAVRDLEAVREALGYSSLNLIGLSYGTRVAQHYAKRYPASTRTIILDGVVPPQLSLGPQIATEAQKALDNIFLRCAADEACNERFPGLSSRFDELLARLKNKPARVRVPHPVTGKVDTIDFGHTELAAAVRILAYTPRSVAMLPLMIAEAADGNLVPIAARFQVTLINFSESLSIGMHNSVMCTEDAPFYDDTYIDRAALAASYMGPLQLEALQAICSVWPAGPIDDDFKAPLSTDIPTLLLSGSADPITPPGYADMASVNLRKAWLLTGTNQGHGQLPVGCMPRVIERFVSAAALEDNAADCFRNSFVMPFFLDFSGPQP
jgi:pimeloyl-ACP methyl ester carboxylesterase